MAYSCICHRKQSHKSCGPSAPLHVQEVNSVPKYFPRITCITNGIELVSKRRPRAAPDGFSVPTNRRSFFPEPGGGLMRSSSQERKGLGLAGGPNLPLRVICRVLRVVSLSQPLACIAHKSLEICELCRLWQRLCKEPALLPPEAATRDASPT